LIIRSLAARSPRSTRFASATSWAAVSSGVTADLVHEHLQRIRGRRRRVRLVRALLGRLADLDATLLEGSIEHLEVFGLEFVCLGERIELVRAHETLLGGFVEQGLDFRGLQGGTDGGSFRSSEWTERLFAEGGAWSPLASS